MTREVDPTLQGIILEAQEDWVTAKGADWVRLTTHRGPGIFLVIDSETHAKAADKWDEHNERLQASGRKGGWHGKGSSGSWKISTSVTTDGVWSVERRERWEVCNVGQEPIGAIQETIQNGQGDLVPWVMWVATSASGIEATSRKSAKTAVQNGKRIMRLRNAS